MSNNVSILQSMYEAFGRGDVPTILGNLRPDVTWEQGTVDHGIPWLKPRTGPAEVAGFFEALGALDFKHFEPYAFLEGPDTVAVLCRTEIVVKATGRTFRDVEVHLWGFDREGRVASFRHFVDTHGMYLALQP